MYKQRLLKVTLKFQAASTLGGAVDVARFHLARRIAPSLLARIAMEPGPLANQPASPIARSLLARWIVRSLLAH